MITGLVLIVGLLFTFIAEVVGSSIEQLGQSDRPVRGSGHLLVVGGVDLGPVATRAVADATKLGARLEHLVVLAPESARESRAQLRASLDEAAGDLKVDLVFGDTAGESGFDLAAADRARAILLMPSSSGPVVAEAADVEVTQGGFALLDYLKEREATPLVRLLFRRGRNVDASWELFPSEWDAVVGDRTVGAALRVAITSPTALEKLPGGLTEDDAPLAGFSRLVDGAWAAAKAEDRRLRVAIVGCGINAPALMEDLAEIGGDRLELTMIAARTAFDSYLGSETPSGLPLSFVESSPSDPDELAGKLSAARPEIVLVTPSPASWDLRTSDAGATLAVLHVLRLVGPEVPVVSELFLPETAARLPKDPRLLAIAGLRAIAAAVAISIFDPGGAAKLEQSFSAEATDR